MLGIILLAAGQSTRMGAVNKLLLDWDGRPLLMATLEQLLQADIGPVTVVLGHEAAAIAPLLRGYPVALVHNADYPLGMTSSIQAGVRAQGDTDGYGICLSDMPHVRAADYRRLADCFAQQYPTDPHTIVQPMYDGQRGNPTFFAASYRDLILAHTAPEGCKALVQGHSEHVYVLEIGHGGIHQDIDTPADYAKIKAFGTDKGE